MQIRGLPSQLPVRAAQKLLLTDPFTYTEHLAGETKLTNANEASGAGLISFCVKVLMEPTTFAVVLLRYKSQTENTTVKGTKAVPCYSGGCVMFTTVPCLGIITFQNR